MSDRISPSSEAIRARYADKQAARAAVETLASLLQDVARQPALCGSGFLYVVIMDPALGPADASFEEAILYEHAVGDRERWDADYAAYARGKARLSWRHGMDSRQVALLRPHLLRPGDIALPGGVHVDGITVAVSGAFGCFDEAVAMTVAGWLRAWAFRAVDEASTG